MEIVHVLDVGRHSQRNTIILSNIPINIADDDGDGGGGGCDGDDDNDNDRMGNRNMNTLRQGIFGQQILLHNVIWMF